MSNIFLQCILSEKEIKDSKNMLLAHKGEKK